MSKLITAVVIALIASAIASFIIGANPSVPFTSFHALVAGGLLGLILG